VFRFVSDSDGTESEVPRRKSKSSGGGEGGISPDSADLLSVALSSSFSVLFKRGHAQAQGSVVEEVSTPPPLEVRHDLQHVPDPIHLCVPLLAAVWISSR
jgi:hypothetical protein